MIVRTVDAHAAGAPLRLIVDGFPSPRGRTMADKCDWARRHADHLRRGLMLEPRGHADMCGAVLTEPVSPASHAGLLFMHTGGYSAMCGHAVIAATTIALERGLLLAGGDGGTVVYDTPAGTIRATAVRRPHDGVRVDRVSFLNVPSFVLAGGLAVQWGARRIRADIAFGGEFYAIVDSEAAGLPIDAAHLPDLRRAGVEIAAAIDATMTMAHPQDAASRGPGARGRGLSGTIFTGPPAASPGHPGGSEGSGPTDDVDLRNVTVFTDGSVDRSPCGTGTAAVMAVIDAMGLLAADRPFVHESLIGTRFTGRLRARSTVGDLDAIVAEIEGSAWITGDHTFVLQEDDPLKNGFRV